MNRDKQTEEMAHLVCEMAMKPNNCRDCNGQKGGCFTIPKMKKLYDAGYRKASAVAREIFEEIERVAMSKIDADVSIAVLNDTYYIEAIDELKEIYTESGEDK